MVPGDGANSYLYYGTRIMQFPMALVGIAMATAIFPTLSMLAVRGDRSRLRDTLGQAVGITNFVAIPAAVGLVVLAFPIVRFLFEHGEFTRADTEATARVIRAYTLGIPVISALQIVTRAFYAQGDTRTPLRIAFVTVACNLALNLVLVGPLEETGLALATSVTACINLALLAAALRPGLGRGRGRRGLRHLAGVCLLSVGMGGICYMMYRFVDHRLSGRETLLRDAVASLGPVLLGIVVYAAGAWVLRWSELREIRDALRRKDRS
jgi:putative peptidoglycan lipid II flippase